MLLLMDGFIRDHGLLKLINESITHLIPGSLLAYEDR